MTSLLPTLFQPTLPPLSRAAGLGLTVGLGLALAAITLIDLRSLRIPDWLSLPLQAIGLTLAFFCQLVPGGRPVDHLIGAGAGYLLFAAIGAAFFRLRQIEGLGLGDAKLFAAAGAWLGWQGLPQVLLIAAFGGLGQALLRPPARRPLPLAFGPWIALGFFAIWLRQNGRP